MRSTAQLPTTNRRLAPSIAPTATATYCTRESMAGDAAQSAAMADTVVVNGRAYSPPAEPTVVFTIDGGDPRYIRDALQRGLMPSLQRLLDCGGVYAIGRGVMPSLTNPNNLSIVTGVAPNVHGIPGNHYLDPASVEEVQLTDPGFLRAESIHSAMRKHGKRVLAVTAKDKLRRLLGAGGVPSISAERAH